QSIGGGGGLASSASSTSLAQVHKGVYSLTLGGSAGAGGDGGGVSVSTGGQTATHGDWSHALVAQSIGGGGGIAGTSLHQEPLAAAPLDEIAHAVMVGGGQGSDRVSGSSVNPDSDRKSTRLNSSHVKISYAVFCLKKKKKKQDQ